MSLSSYVRDVLDKLNEYLPAKGSKFYVAETPMNNKIRLQKSGATQLRFKQKEIEMEKGAIKCDASTPYREVVGLIRNLTVIYKLFTLL